MSTKGGERPKFMDIANTIAEAQDCDLLLLNGPMGWPIDLQIADLCADRQRRPRLLFILVTEGGNADAAYRIARCLQDSYEHFSCLISGYCKSAGTLVATGATELIMADCGELGPLDVQLSKEDELGETRSGLTVISALQTLHAQAYDAFEYFLLETKRRSRGTITTRTSIQVATELAGKLMAPIYEHVDPMHVGEAGRSLEIASKYGYLLQIKGGNLKPQTLERLTAEYPTHSFIIDRMQAEGLFERVREPNQSELTLIAELGEAVVKPTPPNQEPLLAYLNDEIVEAPALPLTDETRDDQEATPHTDTASPPTGSDGATADAPDAESEPPATPLREVRSGQRG